jgi:hypothetical protein
MRESSAIESEHARQSEDILENLDAIKRDLNAFVSAWTNRLDRVIESSQPIPLDDNQLQMRAEQLKQDRQQWEADCEVEQRAAQERMQQLTHAWLQLESEQRTFLQVKASQKNAVSKTSDVVAVAGGNGNTTPVSVSLSKKLSASMESTTASPDRPRQGAAFQFQRLRHEMDSGRSGNDQR